MRKSFSNNNNETGSLSLSQPLFYIFQSVQSQPRPCELWLGPITGLIMGGSRFSLNNQGNSQTDRRSKLNGFQARLEEQIAWVGPSQSFWGNKTDLTQAGNYQNIHHFAPPSFKCYWRHPKPTARNAPREIWRLQHFYSGWRMDQSDLFPHSQWKQHCLSLNTVKLGFKFSSSALLGM